MNKGLLTILFSLTLAFGVPTMAGAVPAIEISELEINDITVSFDGSTLHISGASGQVLYIYNIAGVRIMSVKIDSHDKKMELNLAKGCYIIKVGKIVRKVSIRS